MSFTLYTDSYHASEIDPEKLKHHYYVQLTPDRKDLVPGALQQGSRPGGGWLDVTAIDRDFSKRYFAQYTDFNTLVPGSLVEEIKLPAGKWKEIKRTRKKFHRVVFSDQLSLTFRTTDTSGTLVNFSSQDSFIGNRVNPILDILYPNAFVDRVTDMLLPGGKLINFILYYFKGDYAALNGDVTRLTPFGSPNLFGSRYANSGFVNTAPVRFNSMYQSIGTNLYGISDLTDGTYSFIVGVLRGNIAQNNVQEYIVLENLLVKSVSDGIIPLPL
jgi:hypothetical protein